MMLFGKKNKKPVQSAYDAARIKPAIRCSICTGEQVAGFRHLDTGAFEEIMLLRGPADLQAFRETYGIAGDIEKFY